MSVLQGFLQPSPMDETTEVVISERFKGEDGKPLAFKIRKIDQETANSLLKKCQRTKTVNGQSVRETDNVKYSNLLILQCVVEPNFRDAEMCEYYKVIDPADIPGRMFSLGEYSRLSDAIMAFNDFDTPEKIETEAKN